MPASSFAKMTTGLTAGKNGSVIVYDASTDSFRKGKADGPEVSREDLKHCRVIVLHYGNPKAPPSERAADVARAMKAATRVMGFARMDVVAHSQGCLDLRQHLATRPLAERGFRIGKLVMIGPPTLGSAMGNLGAIVGGVGGIDKAAAEMAEGSAFMRRLINTWPEQREQIELGTTVIANSAKLNTLSAAGIVDGDGFIPLAGIAPEGAKLRVLPACDPTPFMHRNQIGNVEVIKAVFAALGE
jgi:pimeloyl-ACP methyl ester carboxylesterase